MPTARPPISAVPGGEHLHVSSAVLTLSIYIPCFPFLSEPDDRDGPLPAPLAAALTPQMAAGSGGVYI